jgi:hypothetical protein
MGLGVRAAKDQHENVVNCRIEEARGSRPNLTAVEMPGLYAAVSVSREDAESQIDSHQCRQVFDRAVQISEHQQLLHIAP